MNLYPRTVPDNVTTDNEQLAVDSVTSIVLYPVIVTDANQRISIMQTHPLYLPSSGQHKVLHMLSIMKYINRVVCMLACLTTLTANYIVTR